MRTIRSQYVKATSVLTLAGLLPLCASIAVCAQASAQNSSPSAAAPPDKVIVFIGDSIAQGYGVAANEAFPEVAGEWLRAHGHKVKVIDAGVSGSVTAGADKRLKWYLRLRPDIVFFELGGNDGLKGTPVATIKQNLKEAIVFAKANHTKPVLAGMQIFANLGEVYARQFAAIYPQLAKETDVPLMPFLLKGVALDPKLNQADGKHPNAAGHRIVGEAVGRFLEGLL